MSLILEALNKAENERSGESTQSTAATYSMSLADTNWRRTFSLIFFAVAATSFAIYLSRPYFSTQPEAPAITTQSTKAQTEPDQQTIEQPPTEKAFNPTASIAATSTKATPAPPASSINNDNAMRLQTIALTPDINSISTNSQAAADQHEQESSQPLIKPTPTANPEVTTTLDTNELQTTDSASLDDGYMEAPIFQNLSSVIKSQLPNLELNIHVYSTNPLKSFVYINSKRYRQGATIENGITLEKVIPTGVILRHQETLFRLTIES